MDHTRKLVLVPEALYKQLMPLENVDREMENTLKGGHPDQKLKQYNTLLKKYRKLQNKMSEPAKVQISEDQTKPMSTETIVSALPPSLKEKGKSLLSLFKGSPLRWDHTGQISYQGQKVHYSNVQDLISDVFKKRKNYNPEGWTTFARALGDLNVPKEYVTNPDRRRHINTTKGWKSY